MKKVQQISEWTICCQDCVNVLLILHFKNSMQYWSDSEKSLGAIFFLQEGPGTRALCARFCQHGLQTGFILRPPGVWLGHLSKNSKFIACVIFKFDLTVSLLNEKKHCQQPHSMCWQLTAVVNCWQPLLPAISRCLLPMLTAFELFIYVYIHHFNLMSLFHINCRLHWSDDEKSFVVKCTDDHFEKKVIAESFKKRKFSLFTSSISTASRQLNTQVPSRKA